MDYLILLKLITGLLFLLVIPGFFSLIFLQRKTSNNIDIYEGIVYSFIVSVLLWTVISFISFKYEIKSSTPIFLVLFFALFSIFYIIKNSNINFKYDINIRDFWFLPIATLISILIGYSTQYQTSSSDAFAHLANIRNIYSSTFIENCDGLLGPGHSTINTYGCNPWILAIGEVYKLTNIDPALGHTTIASFMCMLFILSSYVFFKAISNDKILSKILALIFFAINIINSIYTWGPSAYFFDPLGNLLFPFHFASKIVILILFSFLAHYFFTGKKIFIYLFIVTCYVITRLHPISMIWVPASIISIIFIKIISYDKIKNIKENIFLILSVLLIVFINILDILGCNNIHEFDANIISPLKLWENSGGNLLYLSKNLYISNPIIYLRERGLYDLLTFITYIIFIKNKNFNTYLSNNNLIKNIHICAILYLGIILSIYSVIFNPLATAFLINYSHSSIPIYRAFLFFNAPLACLTLYFLILFVRAILLKRIFIPVISIVSSLLIAAILYTNLDYLTKIYFNYGKSFSTNSSVLEEPFRTLRGLEPGKVAVNASISTAVAALTNLDPIITEPWRAKSLLDHQVDSAANSKIISFGSDCDELGSLLRRYKIRWVVSDGNKNSLEIQRKSCSFIVFKKTAGNYSVWEIYLH